MIDEQEATVYTHPAAHPASMITQDSSHRFVTDAEKNTWNKIKSDVENNIKKELNNLTATVQNMGTFQASSTAPAKRNILWIDTSAGGILKYHNGSSWVAVNTVWG